MGEFDSGAPSRHVRQIIEAGEAVVSVVSLWELITKQPRKNAPLTDPVGWWERYVKRAGVVTLSIRPQHMIRLQSLPYHHRDPFDRILIAQGLAEGLRIVSADQAVASYLPMFWS